MKRQDLSYNLPEDRIAQTPASPRDSSKLLHIQRDNDVYQEFVFSDLPSLLNPGDVLVLNDTKVFNARLHGTRGDLQFELFLTKPLGNNVWEALVHPGRRMKVGGKLTVKDQTFEIVAKDDERGVVHIKTTLSDSDLIAFANRVGATPTPPYITTPVSNTADYQTTFAKTPGSSAAPTAGFHFTPELLQELRDMGVVIAYVTLHIGMGTFATVFADDMDDHPMHAEFAVLPQATVDAIRTAHDSDKRIIAVGTTATRTLEGVVRQTGSLQAFEGDINLYIQPGFDFQVIDGLITNFHMPETTLMALVAAYLETDTYRGIDRLHTSYQYALDHEFRFASFGDAMIIL